VYQRRSKAFRRGTALNFFSGYKKREQAALEVLRDLIVGKYVLIWLYFLLHRSTCRY
jgi:hypothetical protein